MSYAYSELYDHPYMERPNEELKDMLIAVGTRPDGSAVEVYQKKDGKNYFFLKDSSGEIVEFAHMDSKNEIQGYFAAHGIALTEEESEELKEKFNAMKHENEDQILDAALLAFNEKKAREQ